MGRGGKRGRGGKEGKRMLREGEARQDQTGEGEAMLVVGE